MLGQARTPLEVCPAADAGRELVFRKLCTLLAPLNRNGATLGYETVIMSELDVDSIAIFDLIMEVEDAYDITFPMEDISEMRTIGELIDRVGGLMAR